MSGKNPRLLSIQKEIVRILPHIVFNSHFKKNGPFLVAEMLKNLPAIQKTQIQSLGQEDTLEKEMEIHSRTLAWEIPWAKDPGRPQFMGSQRETRLSDFFTFIFILQFSSPWPSGGR